MKSDPPRWLLKLIQSPLMVMDVVLRAVLRAPRRLRPDTDVTSSPEYNFRSFAGTVWKTKVKVALVDAKQYTGKYDR